jgi:hypothetical protein
MATEQIKSKRNRRNVLFGVVVLLLLLSLTMLILPVNTRQQNALVQQKAISAPPQIQKPVPAPASTTVVAAPVIAKPKPVTPKLQTTMSAPLKQVVAKPKPVKPAAVVALSAPEKPKPAPKKVAPPPTALKQLAPKPLETGYRKLGADGTVLPDDAAEWACVQDRATGLIWEVKTDDNSIRDRDNFFTWYDPATERNYGTPGARTGGRCKGDANCDTLAYIQAINQKRLCGFADWRLPVKDELLSLVEYNYNSKEIKASINLEYFPNSVPSWYWTASANPKHPDYAWFVLFRNGLALNALKEQPKHVRLVRGSEAAEGQKG